MLTVKLLGPPEFLLDSQSTPSVVTGRPAALLSYLIVTGQAQSRTVLADLLWDNVAEQQAKNNLRYTLRNLRKLIGDYLVIERETVAFNHEEPHWVDVSVFTGYMSKAAITVTQGITAEVLQELLGLYKSEFLAGFQVEDASVFERWMLGQRRYIHDLFIRGLQLHSQLLLAEGRYQEGLITNHNLLTLEPWREETHRQRMLLLTYSGQRNAALKQYNICCQILAEELDVPPMEETTKLYEQIKAGAWSDPLQSDGHSAAQPTVITPNSQVQPATPQDNQYPRQEMEGSMYIDLGTMPEMGHFQGRESELALLHSWIGRERSRLVTILGIGGQGKSALAATLVQDVIAADSTIAHGFTTVIWRSLDDAPSCTALLLDWLQALGDKEAARRQLTFDHLITRLFAILETRRCLLVLDGYEAILTHCGEENDKCTEQYRSGCEAYSMLLRLLFQRHHASCLLLTSRIRPSILTYINERNYAFNSLRLGGLTLAESTTLLQTYSILDKLTTYQQLHATYDGNPLLLHQAANIINDLFGGDVKAFIEEGFFFLGGIGTTLTEQIAGLSPLAQQLLRELTATGQPLHRRHLWQQLTPPPPKQQYFCALQTLLRTFLIHQEEAEIKLPAPFTTYLTEQHLWGSTQARSMIG